MPGTLPTTWLASAPATSTTDDAAHMADGRATTNRGHNDDNNAHRAKALPSKHNDNARRMADKRARERAGREPAPGEFAEGPAPKRKHFH